MKLLLDIDLIFSLDHIVVLRIHCTVPQRKNLSQTQHW